ncbi:MAG TPA: amidase family protein, partial [Ilumatobacteraceae bacterium]|nr:amidase family protein [Ilumatobacteraceae bacterium]
FDAAVAAVADAGGEVIELDLPGAEHGATLSWLITMYEAAQTYRDAPREQLTAAFVSRLDVGDRITADEYHRALVARSYLAAEARTVFAARGAADTAIDVVMVPSTVSTAPPADDVDRPVVGVPATWPDVLARTIAYFNVTGLPAVSVPAGHGVGGAPVGVQFAGAPFADERVLHIASWFHDALQPATSAQTERT